MMRYVMMMLLIFFASAAFAAEDIAATYVYEGGDKVTLITRDSKHVRMDVSPENYMLLRKDKIYSVSKDEDGQWMVMDMSQMKALAGGGLAGLLTGGTAPAAAIPDKAYTVKYDKTGKKEEIAGYTGVVYHMTTLEDGKVVDQDEIVLCSHEDLKKVNDAWSAIALQMGEFMGEKEAKSLEKATKEANAAGYGGMLRYGKEMKLESLKKQSLAASTYEIPAGAEVMDMGAMGLPQGLMNQLQED
jgi:butyrate kinase